MRIVIYYSMIIASYSDLIAQGERRKFHLVMDNHKVN